MSTTEPVRVMVVDDHPIMRNGLRDALGDEPDFEVVALAADGVEAVQTAQRVEPDVVVMDVMMPNRGGVDACREIMELLPDTKVLMLTASTREDAVVESVAAGATGYLQKDAAAEELAETVRKVAQGGLGMPDRLIKSVFALIRGNPALKGGYALAKLTAREREVLRMFAGGKTYAEIAEARGNRTTSVRNAVYRIQEKLAIESKQELVIWAVEHGLMDEVVAEG